MKGITCFVAGLAAFVSYSVVASAQEELEQAEKIINCPEGQECNIDLDLTTIEWETVEIEVEPGEEDINVNLSVPEDAEIEIEDKPEIEHSTVEETVEVLDEEEPDLEVEIQEVEYAGDKDAYWALGISPVLTGTMSEGPNLWGVEGQVVFDLKMADEWFFHVQIAPGYGALEVDWSDENDDMFTLSEMVGVQYRPLDEIWNLTLGLRHRVGFWGDVGDSLNVLMVEGQVRLELGNFSIAFFVAIGGGWFPQETVVQTGYSEQSGRFEVQAVELEEGLSGSTGLSLEYQF